MGSIASHQGTTQRRPAGRRNDETLPELEEAERLTGGHRLGGIDPSDLVTPHRADRTPAEEQALWRMDITRWQRESQALLCDLERLRTLVAADLDRVREHAYLLSRVGVDQGPATQVQGHLHVPHAQARRAHGRMQRNHEQAMYKLWPVARAVQEALRSAPP